MTNFIFKSPRDLQKISQQLKTILDNQRFLRNDIQRTHFQVARIYNALALQKQVDDYYEEAPKEVPNVDQESD